MSRYSPAPRFDIDWFIISDNSVVEIHQNVCGLNRGIFNKDIVNLCFDISDLIFHSYVYENTLRYLVKVLRNAFVVDDRILASL